MNYYGYFNFNVLFKKLGNRYYDDMSEKEFAFCKAPKKIRNLLKSKIAEPANIRIYNDKDIAEVERSLNHQELLAINAHCTLAEAVRFTSTENTLRQLLSNAELKAELITSNEFKDKVEVPAEAWSKDNIEINYEDNTATFNMLNGIHFEYIENNMVPIAPKISRYSGQLLVKRNEVLEYLQQIFQPLLPKATFGTTMNNLIEKEFCKLYNNSKGKIMQPQEVLKSLKNTKEYGKLFHIGDESLLWRTVNPTKKTGEPFKHMSIRTFNNLIIRIKKIHKLRVGST